MFIFLLMFIPIIAIIISILFFRKNFVWWEYTLLFIIPTIAIIISKAVSVTVQTNDKEYLNFYLVSAEYIEPYSTWDYEMCTRTVCTGSGKTQTCHTETYDCSHCDRYSARYVAYDNVGISHTISESYFNFLTNRWKNKTFVELNRYIVKNWGCGEDGDKYVTKWNNKFENIVPITKSHNYKNIVQCSKSIYNFKNISKIEANKSGLYDYNFDFDKFNFKSIYGVNNITANDKLNRWNAEIGLYKQVHMQILVFKDKSISIAEEQKSFWKGGNKNEFNVCIGINDVNKIQWVKVISWTEVEKLKLGVERSISNMNFDLNDIVDTIAINVRKNYKRKEFKEFSYITVEPIESAMLISFIIVIILTIALLIFFVKNDIDFEEEKEYF